MKRHERLERLLALLRARDGVTVPDLAAELGVSERTVFRDLTALKDRDLPIEGDPGRGGGVRLLPHGPLPAVRLTLDEATGLWLSLALSQRALGLPFTGAAVRARDKVLGALPPARRRELQRLAERVVVGPPATARVASSSRPPSPELLTVFERAFTARLGLGFSYEDREGNKSARRTEPHGLFVQWPVWYVLAHDVDKGASRTFRMDRIRRPRVLEDVGFVPRPAAFIAELATVGALS